MSVSSKKLEVFFNSLRQFLKQCDKAVKFPVLFFLPKSKQGIGLTLFKYELFAHCLPDIEEHCNRQLRLFLVLRVTKSVVSPSKSFKLLVSKPFQKRLSIYGTAKCITFTKIVTILPQIGKIFDSNFDMWLQHSCPGTLPQSKYSGTRRSCELPK